MVILNLDKNGLGNPKTNLLLWCCIILVCTPYSFIVSLYCEVNDHGPFLLEHMYIYQSAVNHKIQNQPRKVLRNTIYVDKIAMVDVRDYALAVMMSIKTWAISADA